MRHDESAGNIHGHSMETAQVLKSGRRWRSALAGCQKNGKSPQSSPLSMRILENENKVLL